MSPELNAQLCKKYPKIFVHPRTGEPQTEIAVDSCCPNTWFPLINSLCELLQFRTDRYGAPQVRARDVKEKRGKLSFLYGGGDDYQDGLIVMAEEASVLLPIK